MGSEDVKAQKILEQILETQAHEFVLQELMSYFSGADCLEALKYICQQWNMTDILEGLEDE